MNKLFLLLISTVLIATACGGDSKKDKKDKTANFSQAVANLAIEIKQADGTSIGRIDIKNSVVEIQIGGTKLVSEAKGDKRKYGSAAGEVALEVKHNEADKFKVRTADGALIWKIKLDTDKIKVSDNEENNNPYQLKRGDNKIKVKDAADVELGDVQVKDGKVVVAAAGKSFIIETNQLSAAYGVLLMEKLSDRDKFVIMAELLAKGQ
jgi:hypothetical protein